MPSNRMKRIAALLIALSTAPIAVAQEADVLALEGRISPDLRYRIRIDYATSLNDHACQFDDSITGMWVPNLESRYETPTIAGETHSLKVPLAYPGGAGTCGWRPAAVFLCVGARAAPDEATACRTLFVLTPVGDKAAPSVAVSCDPASLVCVDAQGHDPAQQVSGMGGPIHLDVASRSLRPAAPKS